VLIVVQFSFASKTVSEMTCTVSCRTLQSTMSLLHTVSKIFDSTIRSAAATNFLNDQQSFRIAASCSVHTELSTTKAAMTSLTWLVPSAINIIMTFNIIITKITIMTIINNITF